MRFFGNIMENNVKKFNLNIAARVSKAHRTYVLNGRKVMDYLRQNPGATNAEIREATGHSPLRLQRMGIAKWKRDDEGVARWYLTGAIARENVKKWANEEEEIEEVKWAKYTNQ